MSIENAPTQPTNDNEAIAEYAETGRDDDTLIECLGDLGIITSFDEAPVMRQAA